MKITTERLYIRPIQMSDAENLFNYRKDTRANQFQGWVPQSFLDAQIFIQKTASEINQANTWFQLAVLKKETNELIGDIGIHFKEEIEQIGLGYTIAEEHQRNGFAREALSAIITLLFTEMNKHRITASVDPSNLPSVKLLEKLQFRKEAHFIESYKMNDEWVDDVVYAILAKEWILK